jgi:hypothetical protein
MPKLNVPMFLPLQEDGHSCVPRCVKMILMYIENSFEDRVPDFDIEKIGKITETRRDGTYPEKIMNLNKVKEVLTAMPSIEFEYEMKRHTIDEIEKELKDKQPLIAWVTLMSGRRPAHAVVITGLDMETRTVYYNDPIFGEQEEDLPSFLTRWEDQDRTLIKTKIGKKTQRILEEFHNEESKSSATQEIGAQSNGNKP